MGAVVNPTRLLYASSSMVVARGTALVLGINKLGQDVARALAATDAFARVFTAGTMAPAVRNRHRRIDFLDRGAKRRIATALADFAPDCVVMLAVSESPVAPERESRHDAIAAESLARGIRLWRERGGRLKRIVALSATAVYGLARSSPVLFDERSTGRGEHGDRGPSAGALTATAERIDLDAASRYGRWVRGLREYEATLSALAAEQAVKLAVLRSAHVVGGPVASPVDRYLAAVFPVRVLGYDPPMQVIHYDDLVDAILRACEEDVSGVLNVVARGTVPVTRMGALAGRYLVPLPLPLARMVAPDALGAEPLRARCIADGGRAVQLLGIRPRLSAEEALGG